ncbi:suppressor of cytokine signaling 2-like isoform X2 [Agrilus planipennis]|nr:suppressor of cytokine signaling 2-like isoform X2 [Agrilus planipennis]
MLGCRTVCPKCQHQFVCCPPTPCCNVRRSIHGLSGGGLVSTVAANTTNSCTSPQVSPSAPLTFVMPPFNTLFQPTLPPQESRPESELDRLSNTVHVLRQSGWYFEGISYQQSHDMLQDKPLGTFLVRESSDPRFLFSLSVQTERGPTSVRIHYINGYFRLDAQNHLQAAMPMFSSVIDLVQHYVRESRNAKGSAHVWVDPDGKWYSAILLVKPLRKDNGSSSLKHLSRLAVHATLEGSTRPRLHLLPPPYTQLELPPLLIKYLAEYPHSL